MTEPKQQAVAETTPLVCQGRCAPMVLRCGHLRHPDGTTQRLRAKHSYRLFGVIDGMLVVQGELSLGPGSLALIPPGGDRQLCFGPSSAVLQAVFDVVPVPRRRSAQGDWIHLAPARPQPSPREMWGVDLPLQVPPALCAAGLGALHLIRAMYWRSPAGHARACGHLGAFLGNLAYHCAQAPAPAVAGASRSRVLQQALQLIDDPQAAPLSVAAVAELVGTSREHLSRLAQRELGRSLRAVIQTRRREMACRLLLDTDQPVSAIADDLNYRSEASFYRAFRRWFGVTPSDFRQRR